MAQTAAVAAEKIQPGGGAQDVLVMSPSRLEELASPYYAFKDAGYSITIASPKGGKIPLDPASVDDPKCAAACATPLDHIQGFKSVYGAS